jgi:hypothetical protein
MKEFTEQWMYRICNPERAADGYWWADNGAIHVPMSNNLGSRVLNCSVAFASLCFTHRELMRWRKHWQWEVQPHNIARTKQSFCKLYDVLIHCIRVAQRSVPCTRMSMHRQMTWRRKCLIRWTLIFPLQLINIVVVNSICRLVSS